MKKYFACSDIHSFYDEWMLALKNKKFNIDNPEHIIIICGDLFDRGPKSFECLNFAIKMLKQNRAICIKGNHECMLEDIFSRGYLENYDIHNMTNKTIYQLTNIYPDNSGDWRRTLELTRVAIQKCKENKNLMYYLHNCKYYYDLGNYVFVHGWLPFEASEIDYHKAKDYDWINSAVWYNGMEQWFLKNTIENKTIVCGHWSTSFGNYNFHNSKHEDINKAMVYMTDNELNKIIKCKDNKENIFETKWFPKLYNKYVDTKPFIDKGIIALDASTYYSRRVNCIVINEKDINKGVDK